MLEKTILVVDADISSLSYLARVLQEQHYITWQSASGKEGLIYAWRDRPDLIIFDPFLQDISPVEFLKKLRRDPRSANTPILALVAIRIQNKRVLACRLDVTSTL